MVAARMPLLEGARLVQRYGARTVLDVDRVSVDAGEVLAIVGPNGAGKSTLFRILMLLERPYAGVVRLGGVEVARGDARARGRLAAVFQRPILFSGTVRYNIEFGLAAQGLERGECRRRVEEALAAMHLTELADAAVQRLSGGEAQRVALARALVLQPDVLLLDEPTANLDVQMRRGFRRDIEQVARQSARSIVLITHDTAEAFSLADRIAVLQDGVIVQAGTPQELAFSPATPFIAELTGAELLLHGRVECVSEGLVAVRLSEHVLVWAVARHDELLARGADAVVAYRPEDVTLTTVSHDSGSSAVNRIAGIVQGVAPAGPLMRVRLEAHGASFVALVTRRSVDALELGPGRPAELHLKAAALHAWRRDVQRSEPRERSS